MKWPWPRRRRKKKVDFRTAKAADALRHLYRNYQSQVQMWGLVILSAITVACLFFISQIVVTVALYVFIIPLLVITFAAFQLSRCRSLVAILKHALMIQQEIDKVDAQKREEEEKLAALEEKQREKREKAMAEEIQANENAVRRRMEIERSAGGAVDSDSS